MTGSIATSPVRDLLACPQCRGPLTDAERSLTCPACRLSYPVVDGIPHLLQEAAMPLPETDI